MDYFDKRERSALLNYPTAQKIDAVAGTTIEVPTAEFLTYYLFHRKRPGKTGYSNVFYLLGIMEDLVFLAETQSFSEILDYARERGTVRKMVRCQFILSAWNGEQERTNSPWDDSWKKRLL